MSNLAYARPQVSPIRETHPRHIEIVTTRAQRKARPKLVYAVVTVASLFVIFAAQLLLSIVVSEGAYQIAGLQSTQKEQLRTQQDLQEKLDLFGSTQYLATNAAALGMVPNSGPLAINLDTNAVFGLPGSPDPGGCGGSCNLVANSLLDGVPLVDPAAPTQTGTAAFGAAQVAGTQTHPQQASPTPDDALPAPQTH